MIEGENGPLARSELRHVADGQRQVADRSALHLDRQRSGRLALQRVCDVKDDLRQDDLIAVTVAAKRRVHIADFCYDDPTSALRQSGHVVGLTLSGCGLTWREETHGENSKRTSQHR